MGIKNFREVVAARVPARHGGGYTSTANFTNTGGSHDRLRGRHAAATAVSDVDGAVEPLRALAERARYAVWSKDILRLSDLDHQRHVNNAVHPGLFTNGRYALIQGRLREFVEPTDAFALVKITIEYMSEMHYPGEVDVGTLVRRIGNSSVTFGQAIFYNGKCAAVAEAVMVMLDGNTRRPKQMPAALAAALRKLAG
jgi:acyl-CoA thioester hydrolase